MRSAVLGLLLISLGACGRAPQSPKNYAPSQVSELATLPKGFVAADALQAGCRVAPRSGGFDDEALGNVDCNFARLSRVLRARAGELSATAIVGKRCRARGGERPRLECSANVARASSSVGWSQAGAGSDSGPAPSAAQVMDLDEPRPQDAEQIRVSFEPRPQGQLQRLPARAYDRVAETHWPSVGRRKLGQVSAVCQESCGDASLRYALRVTAGHVGAGEVTEVKCFQDDGGSRCVATALVPWSS